MSFENTNIISSHGFMYKISSFHDLYKTKLVRCNKGPNILYIHFDNLKYYIEILKKIKSPFVILLGDRITCVKLENTLIRLILNHPFLIRLYCQNWGSAPHSKVISLPIGLDYHTLNKNKFSILKSKWGNYNTPLEQEKMLLGITKPKFKNPLCYVNFKHSVSINTDRKDALDNIPKNLLYIEDNYLTRLESWKKMAMFDYVVSPHGAGLDCHRTWEAICLGCIPIVKKSSLSENELYKDIDVLIVNEWSDVTKELLNKNRNRKKNNSQQLPLRLSINYWKKKIYSEFIQFP